MTAMIHAATDACALYIRMVGISLRAQMQYRSSFILLSIGHFIITGIEMFGVLALFARFGTLTPWTLAEVAFFYGVVNVGFAFSDAFSRGFDVFGARFVKTGDFDRLLLRPRTTVLQLAGYEVTLFRIGRLTQGLAVLVWAIIVLDIDWTWWRVALLAVTLMSIFLFFYALIICQAALSFWTTESLEIMNTLTYGGVEAARYPMAIYEEAFRRFFTYVVPLACVAYFPVVAILGIDDPLGSSRAFQVMAPMAGVAFFAVSLLLWRAGIARYTSTGS
jgi:ABC-2 type transport system permease protein